jgi:SPP1 family predicted phage head-tail adaptor
MDNQINAGDLRNPVDLQTYTPLPAARGSFGQEVSQWTSNGIHYAKIEPLSGREIWNVRQLKATSTIKITMRDVGPIAPGDRLIFNGRIFMIDSVCLLDEIASVLQIMATETKPPAKAP